MDNKTIDNKTDAIIAWLQINGWRLDPDRPKHLIPPEIMLVPPSVHISEAEIVQRILNPFSKVSLDAPRVGTAAGGFNRQLKLVKRGAGTNTPQDTKPRIQHDLRGPTDAFRQRLRKLVLGDYQSMRTWTAVSKARGGVNPGLLWRVVRNQEYSPSVARAYIAQGLIEWDGGTDR